MSIIKRAFAIAAVALMGANPAYAQDEQRIFMYVKEGARDLELSLREEVGVMRQMLEDAGYIVDVATTGDREMTAETVSLAPTIRLENVDIDNYVGVILPCMAPGPGAPSTPAEVSALLELAVARDLPIAASRGAVIQLAQAGGVNGKDYAFRGPVDVSERPEFAGGNYLGIGVVRDGNVSTAGICPVTAKALNEVDGTAELTQQFIATLAEAT